MPQSPTKLIDISQLIARINADEVAHARSISTETRPTTLTPTKSPATRHFNTSRALKAVNDSSTIDFAFLPEVLGPEDIGIAPMRVPILPDVNSNGRNAAIASEEIVVMLPQISTMVSTCWKPSQFVRPTDPSNSPQTLFFFQCPTTRRHRTSTLISTFAAWQIECHPISRLLSCQ